MNFAKVLIGGHVGGDPKTRTVGENSVVSFSIAVNKRGKHAAEDKPNWYTCNFWGGRNAENVMQFVKSGMEVVVDGTLEVREYKKNDGTPTYSLEIRAVDFQMASKNSSANGMPSDAAPRNAAPGAAGATSAPAARASAPTPDSLEDDEIPF